ncbi:MAG: hypothetical protein QOJ95_4458 [Mycobacterium sp.]|nr:hypothetical protein [Mycobacterium sp.]
MWSATKKTLITALVTAGVLAAIGIAASSGPATFDAPLVTAAPATRHESLATAADARIVVTPAKPVLGG